MSKFTVRILASAAAVALGASLLSTAAFAAAIPLGNLDPPKAGSFNETVGTGDSQSRPRSIFWWKQ